MCSSANNVCIRNFAVNIASLPQDCDNMDKLINQLTSEPKVILQKKDYKKYRRIQRRISTEEVSRSSYTSDASVTNYHDRLEAEMNKICEADDNPQRSKPSAPTKSDIVFLQKTIKKRRKRYRSKGELKRYILLLFGDDEIPSRKNVIKRRHSLPVSIEISRKQVSAKLIDNKRKSNEACHILAKVPKLAIKTASESIATDFISAIELPEEVTVQERAVELNEECSFHKAVVTDSPTVFEKCHSVLKRDTDNQSALDSIINECLNSMIEISSESANIQVLDSQQSSIVKNSESSGATSSLSNFQPLERASSTEQCISHKPSHTNINKNQSVICPNVTVGQSFTCSPIHSSVPFATVTTVPSIANNSVAGVTSQSSHLTSRLDHPTNNTNPSEVINQHQTNNFPNMQPRSRFTVIHKSTDNVQSFMAPPTYEISVARTTNIPEQRQQFSPNADPRNLPEATPVMQSNVMSAANIQIRNSLPRQEMYSTSKINQQIINMPGTTSVNNVSSNVNQQVSMQNLNHIEANQMPQLEPMRTFTLISCEQFASIMSSHLRTFIVWHKNAIVYGLQLKKLLSNQAQVFNDDILQFSEYVEARTKVYGKRMYTELSRYEVPNFEIQAFISCVGNKVGESIITTIRWISAMTKYNQDSATSPFMVRFHRYLHFLAEQEKKIKGRRQQQTQIQAPIQPHLQQQPTAINPLGHQSQTAYQPSSLSPTLPSVNQIQSQPITPQQQLSPISHLQYMTQQNLQVHPKDSHQQQQNHNRQPMRRKETRKQPQELGNTVTEQARQKAPRRSPASQKKQINDAIRQTKESLTQQVTNQSIDVFTPEQLIRLRQQTIAYNRIISKESTSNNRVVTAVTCDIPSVGKTRTKKNKKTDSPQRSPVPSFVPQSSPVSSTIPQCSPISSSVPRSSSVSDSVECSTNQNTESVTTAELEADRIAIVELDTSDSPDVECVDPDIECIDLTWIEENDSVDDVDDIKSFFLLKEEKKEDSKESMIREVVSPADSGLGSPEAQSDYKCLCGKDALFVCPCNSSMYCSSECQNIDWTDHQKSCNKK